MKLSDEEILQRYKVSGETGYFGELYSRYIPVLYGLGLKYLHKADKAQEAVMSLFTRLLPNISHRNIEVFRTWIHSEMKNHCLQLSGREFQEPEPEATENSALEVSESDVVFYLFSEDAPDSEEKKALKKQLRKLPVEQRIAIIRFYTEEMSYLDIADSTGYNLKQVKNYIREGKRNLRLYPQKNS